MRVALKNPILSQALSPATELSTIRVGAPVVQPSSAKLSLGSTANSYLSNLVESNSLSAVISSIGQMPRELLQIKPQNESINLAVMQNWVEVKAHETTLPSAQVVLPDAPVHMIVSLSETQLEAKSEVATQDWTLDNISPIENLATTEPTSSHVVFGDRPLLASVETTSIETVSPATPITDSAMQSASVLAARVVANDLMSTASLSSLVSNVPISPISSLASNPVDTSSELNPIFNGISVSGQADTEFIFVAVNSRPGLIQGSVANRSSDSHVLLIASEVMQPSGIMDGAGTLTQHSIILIDLSTWQDAEIFSI